MSNNNDNIIESSFFHVTLTGTSYEAGKMQASAIKNTKVEKMITSNEEKALIKSKNEIESSINLIMKYCPGVYDEIKGFADELGVPVEKIAYFAYTYNDSCNCSHFSILPPFSKNNHTYAGRSYEFNPDMSDRRLCITKIKDKFNHIGFSEIFFGRDDGINEHGLCITFSASPHFQRNDRFKNMPNMPLNVKGLAFWAVVRTVLDTCKNVEEAIEYIKNVPIAFYSNLIITDIHNNSALVEVSDENKKAIHTINDKTDDKYIIATNHFMFTKMVAKKGIYKNSNIRYNIIRNFIENNKNNIDEKNIKEFLSAKYPDGLSANHYVDYFGTLWSLVFDVTDKKVEVCFGSPADNNKWYSFDFNTTIPFKMYPVRLLNEPSPDGFWEEIEHVKS